ncbi:hypothetical protein BDN70DRAFT_572076 [Pholiota conissans]|uniref:Transmembrane protein n=1 Tax=Pholiota conissans TaxID=109636 RepID=A0A9P5Z6G6_9AGAR|nr:hypothetical protein BDN70DRAFT_572076 [Pholiota conissans]
MVWMYGWKVAGRWKESGRCAYARRHVCMPVPVRNDNEKKIVAMCVCMCVMKIMMEKERKKKEGKKGSSMLIVSCMRSYAVAVVCYDVVLWWCCVMAIWCFCFVLECKDRTYGLNARFSPCNAAYPRLRSFSKITVLVRVRVLTASLSAGVCGLAF